MDTPMIITKDRHRDSRGTFCEMFNAAYWDEKGIRFVTDNWSWSRENVFRGLHYQTVNPQGKLVSVADGVILDICVDVREGSDCYGKSYWYALSGSLAAQLWIPPGFAHGYLALSDAIVIYKTTQYRHEEFEVVIRYDDPALGLQLPDRVIVSEKDRNGILLADAPRVKV
jgi:dTDP-4-dehydrorhamnose 3,5-epimerase